MTPEREKLCCRFLEQSGWAKAGRSILAADASFRTYERLTLDGKTAVLMNAPPSHENVTAFRRVQDQLLDLGFSAPACLAEDLKTGFLLLEDFGDLTFTRALAGGAKEEELYELACDLLVALHKRAPSKPEGLPPYDGARLEEEAVLLPDWYYEAIYGEPISASSRDAYLEAWRTLWPAAQGVPDTLVLRDYHVDNLILIPGREGLAACGLLDFQDALCGPVTYDLVSLLQDARRDIPPRLEQAMLTRYLAGNVPFDEDAFRLSYRILGAQRAAKIIGIFTRLSLRDGKHGYLDHIERVWSILERNLKDPALGGVAAWFDDHIPAPRRRRPEVLSAVREKS